MTVYNYVQYHHHFVRKINKFMELTAISPKVLCSIRVSKTKRIKYNKYKQINSDIF